MSVNLPSAREPQSLTVLPIGASRISISYDWTGAVTAQTIKAAPADQRLVFIQISGSTKSACDITLFLDADSVANRVAQWHALGRGRLEPVYFPGWRVSAVDGILRITTTTWNSSTPAGTVTVEGFSLP